MKNFILSLNFKNLVKASLISFVILIASLSFGCCLNASAMFDDEPSVIVNLSNDIDDEAFTEDLKHAVTADNTREIAKNRFPDDLAKQALYNSNLSLYNILYREESNGVQRALNDFHNDIKLPGGKINCGSYYIEVGSSEVGSSKKHPYDYDIDDKERIEIENYQNRLMRDPSSC